MLPLRPESGKQPVRGCGGALPPRKGCRGSRWGRKMAAGQGGLCATSATIRTHTRASGQSRFKKSTPALQLSAAFVSKGACGESLAGGSGDARSVEDAGCSWVAAEPGGESLLDSAPLLFWGGGGKRGEQAGLGPFLWLLCHPGTDQLQLDT